MSFRRSLLTALLAGGAAAAAKLLSTVPSDQRTRYQQLISAQLDLLVTQDAIMTARDVALKLADENGTWGPGFIPAQYREPQELRTQMSQQFTTLLGLLVSKFNGSKELEDNYADLLSKVSAVFNRTIVIDTFSEDELERWENTVINIAVMRHMLADRRMIFNPSTNPHWNEFVNIYQKVILAA